jgi:GT2 family glycosyltransferase
MQMNNKTAIVILNYKNYTETINCINSIYAHIQKELLCIIAVDNASGNNSLSYINDSFKTRYNVKEVDAAETATTNDADIFLIQSHINKGYAAGNNLGLEFAYNAGFGYLMVLNNDTLFIEDSLTILKHTLDKHQNVLCVGPLLVKGDGVQIDYNCAKRRPTPADIFKASYFGRWLKNDDWKNSYYYLKKYPNLNEPIVVDVISGSCMLFRADKLQSIGFFDSKTFLYYEEAILHEKGKAVGLVMMLDPTTTVVHLGAQTTKSQSTSSFILQCEYNSLKHYIKTYRKFDKLTTAGLLLSYKSFINAYKLLKEK